MTEKQNEILTPLTDELLAKYLSVIGDTVTVTMDRPIGTVHPKHPDVIYPINYGYVDGLIGGDGEEQDVYVLGEDKPLKTFCGVIIAVVHRFDDNECKWVACRSGESYTAEEIEKSIYFQEKYHCSKIITK